MNDILYNWLTFFLIQQKHIFTYVHHILWNSLPFFLWNKDSLRTLWMRYCVIGISLHGSGCWKATTGSSSFVGHTYRCTFSKNEPLLGLLGLFCVDSDGPGIDSLPSAADPLPPPPISLSSLVSISKVVTFKGLGSLRDLPPLDVTPGSKVYCDKVARIATRVESGWIPP